MKTLLAAIVPGFDGEPVPRWFPAHVRVALRLSAIVATACALVWTGRPLGLLPPPGREAVLERMAHHRLAPLRALVQWWKLVALTR